jgi:hypothetical protein
VAGALGLKAKPLFNRDEQDIQDKANNKNREGVFALEKGHNRDNWCSV